MGSENGKVFRTAQQGSPDYWSVGLEVPGELTHTGLVVECFSGLMSKKTDLMRSVSNLSKLGVRIDGRDVTLGITITSKSSHRRVEIGHIRLRHHFFFMYVCPFF
jgi:hypothetical protein